MGSRGLSIQTTTAAALVSLTLVFACGPLHRVLPVADAGRPGVIPWLPLPAPLMAPSPPSPTPSPLPAGTEPCTPAQLRVDVLGSNGAGGNVFISFGFAGRDTNACFVQGSPRVALFDRSGRLLPFKVRSLVQPPMSTGPVLVEPGPLPDPKNALKYGQAAVTIDWVSQPEQCPGSTGVQVAAARITLPGAGAALMATLPPAEPTAYICQGLGVGGFEGPFPIVDQPPSSPLPAIAVNAPSGVLAGQVLRYRMTFTNDTKQPMDLRASCPNYEEELFLSIADGTPPLGGKHFYQLNCAPAGTIKPNASLTFEMRLAVPRDATPGAYTLVFMLGYWNAMTKSTDAQVRISTSP